MKFVIERTLYVEHKLYYEVAFTITDDNGYSLYTPVTVYKYDLHTNNPTEVQVMEYAARQALPGQVAQYYGRKPKSNFFDDLEKSLKNG